MDKETLKVLEKLTKNIETHTAPKPNIFIDVAVKTATVVSTLGIVALFGLFTTLIPELNRSIDKLNWQQEQMQNSLEEFKKFTSQPRFTKENFDIEMRLYERRLMLLEDGLTKRLKFADKIEERVTVLERDLYITYPDPRKKKPE